VNSILLKKSIFLLISSFLLYFIFFWKQNHHIITGDSGYLLVQIENLIDSFSRGHLSFEYIYKGSLIDEEYAFLPYRVNDLIYIVSGKPYIVFPPFLPLINSFLFLLIKNSYVFYILNFISAIAIVYYLFKTLELLSLRFSIQYIIVLLLFFGTGISQYLFVLHETILAYALLTISLYYFLLFIKENNIYHYIVSLLLIGIGVYFRIEYLIIFIAYGFSILLFYRQHLNNSVVINGTLTIVIVILPIILFNQIVYGHPLGLRYYSINPKLEVMRQPWIKNIFEIFFDPIAGIFFQSSFLLLFFIPAMWNLKEKENQFLLFSSLLIFFSIFFAFPYQGGHPAPRYIFPVYAFLLPLFGRLFQEKILNSSNFKKIGILIPFILLILFSFKLNLKTIKWLHNNEKYVGEYFNFIKQCKSDTIVFSDFDLMHNFQTLDKDKVLFSVDSYEKFNLLTEKFSNKNIKDFCLVSLMFEFSPKEYILRTINLKLLTFWGDKESSIISPFRNLEKYYLAQDNTKKEALEEERRIFMIQEINSFSVLEQKNFTLLQYKYYSK
jgi:hypothetical protein